MRSITAKLICTLIIMALLAGGIYWAATAPWMPQDHSTSTGTQPQHEHSFDTWWSSDAAHHWNACECGMQTNAAPHTDSDVNGKCDVCDANVPLPPHAHSFGTKWISNSTYHWNVCECGEQTNKASHIDIDSDEACDICGAVVPHEHFFDVAWVTDETNHWNVCSCGETSNLSAHVDSDFDEKCDICNAHTPHVHDFGTVWQTDEVSHWNVCACGEITNTAAHVDADINEKCDVCDAHVPHTHDFGTTWESSENEHWQVCGCGEQSASDAHADNDGDHRCDVCAYVVSFPEPPELYGHTAFVFDCTKNDYLFKNQSLDKTIYPASITKLFTCYVALQYLKDLSEVITLGKEQSFFKSDSSQVWIDEGDKVSVDFLLHGTLMESGADAAYGLAAAAGYRILGNTNATARQAVDAFMAEMNEYAKNFGMSNTHFVYPDGYHHAEHVVSFQSMLIIAQCAMSNETIRNICGKDKVTMQYTGASGKVYHKTLNSTNVLLFPNHKDYKDKYYIPQCVGLKTGYTSAAGRCFMGLFIHDGKAVIIGVFGCPTDENRWQDMKALWEYYLTLQSLT